MNVYDVSVGKSERWDYVKDPGIGGKIILKIILNGS
jgi:hypothetical protein